MANGAPAPTYDVKSAFQAFYFLVFGAAVIAVAVALFGGDNPILAQLKRILPVPDLNRATEWLNWLYWAFLFLYAVHLIRIYMTLELMEDEAHFPGSSVSFAKFFESYGKRGRIVDFFSRLAIVSILTFEIFRVRTFPDFLSFLLLFYIALLIWGLVARFAGKKKVFGQSFLFSSALGLVASVILMVKDGYWPLLIGLGTAATISLAFDLFASNNSVFRYGKMFYLKWATRW